MGDKKYREADAKQTANLVQAIRIGQRQLAEEKEKNRLIEDRFAELKKLNKDLYEQKKALEGWRSDLNVEKKPKKALSEVDTTSFKVVATAYFDALRAKHARKKEEVRVVVQSRPPASAVSFSLQQFFDDYYDNAPILQSLVANPKKKQAREKAAKQVAKTRLILFGDIDQGNADEAKYIAHSLLSTWQITFKENAGNVLLSK